MNRDGNIGINTVIILLIIINQFSINNILLNLICKFEWRLQLTCSVHKSLYYVLLLTVIANQLVVSSLFFQ